MHTARIAYQYQVVDSDGYDLATFDTKQEALDALRALKAEDPCYRHAIVWEVPAKPAETYNGWANRATWNAHLWLTGNHENTYRRAVAVAKAGSLDAATADIADFCDNLWGDKTPDGYSLADVDWAHIAAALRE